jgi:putative transposase
MKNEKFRNRYRIPSARAPWWDYGRNGAYFVTICTKQHVRFFGKISEGVMYHSKIGELAFNFWKEIPERFSYISLDAFVIMPDHMHGILVIDKMDDCPVNTRFNRDDSVETRFNRDDSVETRFNRVSTGADQKTGGITGHYNPMLHQNLSRVIRWYKGRTCYESRKILPGFAWQGRFYDRIIRDPDEWGRIRRYIDENPGNWKS